MKSTPQTLIIPTIWKSIIILHLTLNQTRVLENLRFFTFLKARTTKRYFDHLTFNIKNATKPNINIIPNPAIDKNIETTNTTKYRTVTHIKFKEHYFSPKKFKRKFKQKLV